MRSRTFIGAAIALTSILTMGPACGAELYKWIDGKGVTNYSNQPPFDAKNAGRLAVVEDKLSVYTPDPTLLRAIEARRNPDASNQEARIRALEQQLGAERRARHYAATAEAQAAQASQKAAYDQCVADRRTDCEGDHAGYYPYVPAVAFVPVHSRHSRLIGPRLKPGTIAGNVTAGHGIIPGNSAFASAGRNSRSARFQDDVSRRTFRRR